MYQYKKNVKYSMEDNAYIVSVPDLPGCMADGKTEIEAMQNADIIISEWIETAMELGRRIPTPSLELAVS